MLKCTGNEVNDVEFDFNASHNVCKLISSDLGSV